MTVAVVLGAGAVLAALTLYPYLATTLSYRGRDNGLAFIVMLMGVSVWNGFLAAQLLTGDPRVASYFLSLSMVGALLAAVGWFLFASTASSTPDLATPRLLYGLVATVAGVDIVLLVTNPVHQWYWVAPGGSLAGASFAVVTPTPGYWLHTLVVVTLFGSGLLLFYAAWEAGTGSTYTVGYTVGALVTAGAVAGSNIVAPGGWTVAPIVAVGLTSTGWVQAQRGDLVGRLRAYRRRVVRGGWAVRATAGQRRAG